MLPCSQRTLAIALLCAPALAQGSASTNVRPVTSPVRDGGVYHVDTGTWTRKASHAAIGASVIFNNDCAAGYFSPQSNDAYVDEGRLPDPGTTATLTMGPGCQYAYTINGFQIAYCTDDSSVNANVAFYDNYVPCATVVGATPAGSVTVTSLPASSFGMQSCWILTIDLGATPPVGAPFVLQSGSFGYALQINGATTGGTNTGPLIAGDPTTCPRGAGTIWYTGAPASGGTGFGSQDQFRVEGPATTPGCYFFGGNPFASFYMRLHSDACGQAPGASRYCPGNGTGTACPCGNNAPSTSQGGCLNSVAKSALLTGIGVSSISADSFGLSGVDMTPSSTVLYFQGTTMTSGGSGTVFGDGKRCASGTVVRLGTKTNVNGASLYPGPSDPTVSVKGLVTAPGTRFYQAWYRDPASFCTSATFNLTNGAAATWTP